MSRLREKTTATLLIAIFMISAFAVAMPVSAEDWGKPEVRVRAIGHFTSVWSATEGHECFVNIHARRVTDGWTGRGVFWDEDYGDGKLIAVITVDSATLEDLLPNQIILHGTIKVIVNDEYIGNYEFASVICPSIRYVTFQISELDYLAYVYGDFSSVRLTIEVQE